MSSLMRYQVLWIHSCCQFTHISHTHIKTRSSLCCTHTLTLSTSHTPTHHFSSTRTFRGTLISSTSSKCSFSLSLLFLLIFQRFRNFLVLSFEKIWSSGETMNVDGWTVVQENENVEKCCSLVLIG